MIEADIYSVLSTAAPITAITTTNIFPVALPEDPVLPALTYKIVGGSAQATFNTSGMIRSRVQIDCWGLRYLDVVNVRAAVIQALNGYSDSNMTVQFLQTTDDFEYEALQYRAIVEFYVFYTLA